MKNVNKIEFAARASRAVAIGFAVTCVFNSFVCVVPWLEAAHQRFSLIVAVSFLLFFSFAAILYGTASAPCGLVLLCVRSEKVSYVP